MPPLKSSKARLNWKISSIIKIFISPPPPNANRPWPNKKRLRLKLSIILSICPLSRLSSRRRTINIGSFSPFMATIRSRSTLGSQIFNSSKAVKA